MSIVGCGIVLEGPKPKLSKFGLLTALDSLTTPTDPHWQGGFQIEDIHCSSLDSTLPNCPPPTGVIPPKAAHGGPTYCCSDPFTVYSSFKCPPVGFDSDRAYEIAQARFDANIQTALETIFWTGQTDAGPIEPSLATGNSSCGLSVVDLTPAGGALNALAGLAVLEQAIGTCYPGQALIHMSNGILPFVADRARLVDTGDALYTYAGSRVIAGKGYRTTGPGGSVPPAGEGWMFATSQIVGFKSDPFFTPPKDDSSAAMNRSINDRTVRLEQTWAFSFSCCIFAVRVKLTGCDCC